MFTPEAEVLAGLRGETDEFLANTTTADVTAKIFVSGSITVRETSGALIEVLRLTRRRGAGRVQLGPARPS